MSETGQIGLRPIVLLKLRLLFTFVPPALITGNGVYFGLQVMASPPVHGHPKEKEKEREASPFSSLSGFPPALGC